RRYVAGRGVTGRDGAADLAHDPTARSRRPGLNERWDEHREEKGGAETANARAAGQVHSHCNSLCGLVRSSEGEGPALKPGKPNYPGVLSKAMADGTSGAVANSTGSWPPPVISRVVVSNSATGGRSPQRTSRPPRPRTCARSSSSGRMPALLR